MKGLLTSGARINAGQPMRILRPQRCETCAHSRPPPQGAAADQVTCVAALPHVSAFLVPTGPSGQTGIMTHTAFPVMTRDQDCAHWKSRSDAIAEASARAAAAVETAKAPEPANG